MCAHDEDDLWASGFDLTETPTLEEFLGMSYQGQLTTMSLEMLAEFMYAHRDFYVVTDVKDDNVDFCQHLKDTYPDLMDQFIIQIYHGDEYDPVHDMGFESIIYTLYDTNADERTPDVLLPFLEQHELLGVTLSGARAVPGKTLFDTLSASGVPLFVHTINDADSMREFFDLGISGIYTDIVDRDLRYDYR